MSSIYHAYQAYEKKITRGEFCELPGDHKTIKPLDMRLSYRLGDLLVRTGLKLKRHACAGYPLTAVMAQK